MFGNPLNQKKKGDIDKKSIPCKFFAMGTCNKGNDCPYRFCSNLHV